uniref:Asp-tRNA(Asn)/Glu-tRNA(Gln) amidotransferase subunit GatC n=1 Tax=Candidatus Electronema sp. TaxID=2698783 RepID=UPI004056855A
MKITREEMEKTARLARLELNSEETERITAQLDNILSYVAKLDEIDTSGFPAETHLFGATNAFRDDEVLPSLLREAALANSPRHDDAAFVVPRVIG